MSKFGEGILKTNIPTMFYEDWTKVVTSTALLRHIRMTSPSPSGHIFQQTETIFELDQNLEQIFLESQKSGTNVVTKFQEDRIGKKTSWVKNCLVRRRSCFSTDLNCFRTQLIYN
ncbi:hypothetical protein DPMN_096909 [Dreissena polymorpha]|uniref:Uncharacterized protein n=1 Tax=Dreissena polymorpha TaxID=45954 RepID=A0A9D4R4X6_DREPO|nr:hypothetical protein DPMN_096909 [Dreissena polymorpha]